MGLSPCARRSAIESAWLGLTTTYPHSARCVSRSGNASFDPPSPCEKTSSGNFSSAPSFPLGTGARTFTCRSLFRASSVNTRSSTTSTLYGPRSSRYPPGSILGPASGVPDAPFSACANTAGLASATSTHPIRNAIRFMTPPHPRSRKTPALPRHCPYVRCNPTRPHRYALQHGGPAPRIAILRLARRRAEPADRRPVARQLSLGPRHRRRRLRRPRLRRRGLLRLVHPIHPARPAAPIREHRRRNANDFYGALCHEVGVRVPLWTLAAGPLALASLLAFTRPVRGCCGACGYNLTGLRAGVCPECGLQFTAPC